MKRAGTTFLVCPSNINDKDPRSKRQCYDFLNVNKHDSYAIWSYAVVPYITEIGKISNNYLQFSLYRNPSLPMYA